MGQRIIRADLVPSEPEEANGRTVFLHLRLTPLERAAIEAMARIEGVALSEFYRTLMMIGLQVYVDSSVRAKRQAGG